MPAVLPAWLPASRAGADPVTHFMLLPESVRSRSLQGGIERIPRSWQDRNAPVKSSLRILLLGATVVLPVVGGMVAPTASASAQTIHGQASTMQSSRADMLRVLEVGAFAVGLDRAWDYMAVAPHNMLDRSLGLAQKSGLPHLGISAAEANAVIQRGFGAATAFVRAKGKHSPEGRAMMNAMKDIFEQ
jgi:hypothetical protein